MYLLFISKIELIRHMVVSESERDGLTKLKKVFCNILDVFKTQPIETSSLLRVKSRQRFFYSVQTLFYLNSHSPYILYTLHFPLTSIFLYFISGSASIVVLQILQS